jgi:hypothetical protein
MNKQSSTTASHIENTLHNCVKLCVKINSMKYAIEENYPDLARLCERSEMFQSFLDETQGHLDKLSGSPSSPAASSNLTSSSSSVFQFDESFEATLTELNRIFKSILNFINDHTDHKEYFGITDYSTRLSYIVDLTKWSHSLAKVSETLNITSDDMDSEKKRREDFEVSIELSLLAFFLLMLFIPSCPPSHLFPCFPFHSAVLSFVF